MSQSILKKLGLKAFYVLFDPCPKCGCALFIKGIDRVWCMNDNCSYAQYHLIGTGTMNLPIMMTLKPHNPKPYGGLYDT